MCVNDKVTDRIEKRLERFLGCIRQGLRRGAAAKASGLSRNTICLRANKDPEFAARIEQAELDSCELVEDALFKACLAGSVPAMKFFLCNRSSLRWHQDSKVIVSNLPQQESQEEKCLKEILGRLEKDKPIEQERNKDDVPTKRAMTQTEDYDLRMRNFYK